MQQIELPELDYERIEPSEFEYHRKLVQTKKDTDGAWRLWSKHLAEKYQLQDGDQIDEVGVIYRRSNVNGNPVSDPTPIDSPSSPG